MLGMEFCREAPRGIITAQKQPKTGAIVFGNKIGRVQFERAFRHAEQAVAVLFRFVKALQCFKRFRGAIVPIRDHPPGFFGVGGVIPAFRELRDRCETIGARVGRLQRGAPGRFRFHRRAISRGEAMQRVALHGEAETFILAPIFPLDP